MFQERITSDDVNNLTLSEIVKKNYKAAAVFEKYSLDFCCKGNRPVSDACASAGIDAASVISELDAINMSSRQPEFNPDNWNLDFLIDYIVNTHHEYLRKMIPVISAHSDKVAMVHGKNHPEVKEVNRIFTMVYKDLKQHMMKEEQILFPFIKRLVQVKNNNTKFESPYFGSVKNPIRMMETEHQQAGDEMFAIRNLTSEYNAPDDACMTFKTLYQELREFEEDLHRHVHLENYILFPKSTKLEEQLSVS